MLAQNRGESRRITVIFERIAEEYGLEFNKKKCKILVFNSKETEQKINEIEIVHELVYLGIKITVREITLQSIAMR